MEYLEKRTKEGERVTRNIYKKAMALSSPSSNAARTGASLTPVHLDGALGV